VAAAHSSGVQAAIDTAEKALRNNKVLIFNQYLDAVVAGAFLVLVVLVFAICLWEWSRLLARRRAPDLKESPAVLLAEYAVVEGGARPLGALGVATLGFALLKELSGEAETERLAQQEAALCCQEHRSSADQVYLASLDARYKSIRRCC
jgi:carbon starvation protein